jgi:anti-sigma regulatory factor (Ser/Thr protein kinase)
LLADDPDTSLSLEERDEGGLGLFFVKHLADAIDYNRENGLNQLSIMLSKGSEVKA